SRHYTKLKRYWKFVLTHEDNLNYEKRLQYPLFDKKFVTQTEIVDTLLSFDEGFKQCYEIHQTLLGHFKDKEYNEFFDVLDALPRNLDKSFKKSLKYLTKHTRSIKNSLRLPYSNGKLEGKNNLIKVFNELLLGLENLKICEEESFYTKKIGKRKNQRNENVEEKLLKTFSQSHSKCNRWLYQLFVHKRRLKKEKKIKKRESIHKITSSPIDLIANNTT
ncbi:transposase, partial [Enterococcus cecorum]